jgi:hypothetical protein
MPDPSMAWGAFGTVPTCVPSLMAGASHERCGWRQRRRPEDEAMTDPDNALAELSAERALAGPSTSSTCWTWRAAPRSCRP